MTSSTHLSRTDSDSKAAEPTPSVRAAGVGSQEHERSASRHRYGREMMPVITGRHAFLEVLHQEGVEYIFGNPGTTELPLIDALVDRPDFKYILALQESAAVGIADGYAQASGKIGVLNLHVSPGL